MPPTLSPLFQRADLSHDTALEQVCQEQIEAPKLEITIEDGSDPLRLSLVYGDLSVLGVIAKGVALYKRANALGLVAGQTFAFPLTQQHVADALGLSLVHTNKTFARLRRMGMFKQVNDMLTLTNPRVLERVGQYFDEDIPQRPLI